VRKLPARKMLGAMIAGALLIPYEGFTLGLGEIEVNSALNQKLNAEIELLSATPEDTEMIIVKLASRKEFSRAGLDRPYLLNDLRFKSEVIDGVPHIKVSSGSPIREPFLNFLVEVDWPNGQLVREYTVLLDPPVFMTQSATVPSSANQGTGVTNDAGFRPSAAPVTSTSSAPVVIPVPAGASISSAPASQPATQPAAQTSWVPAPIVQQQASINQPPGTYKIKAGDTAWSLANAMRPDQSITVEQMMIAMLRHNPESFIDENVNGLKRGYILRTPDYNQITAISQDEARAMVREHAALWRQYQQARGGVQPVSAMESDAEGSAVISGGEAITSEQDAYLEILSAGSGTSTAGSKDPTQMSAEELRAELALARERVETERVEKEALQQRVDTLEMHVDKMKGMLSIEDQELSTVQSLDQMGEVQTDLSREDEIQADQAMVDEAAIAEAEQAPELALSGEMGEDIAAEAAMTDESVDTDVIDTGAEELASEEIADEQVAGEEALFTDEAGDMADATTEQEAVEPEPVEEYVAPAPAPQVVSTAPSDPLSQILNNPMMLLAAGGGLLLVVALIGLIVRRRKAAAETEAAPVIPTSGNDLESLADDVASVTESEAAAEDAVAEEATEAAQEAEESSFDSDATMILDSTDSAAATEAQAEAAAEDEPRDDVVAEADVYLAYGIYQQAEELLTQAISDNPDRNDYRVKLAETHYSSKNAEAFTEVAGDIKERVSDDSPEWKKVMSMGQDLCADNPMFQGSTVGLDVDSLAPAAAPEMDFDLGLDESVEAKEEAAADLDLSLDEPLDLPEEEVEADAEQTIDAVDETEAEEELEMPAEPVDEIEFDLSDTGAVEESEDKEDEFSLDIDASELDIDILDETEKVTDAGEVSLDLGDVDLGLDEETSDTSSDEVTEVGDVDIDFGLDEEPTSEASASAEEEVALDLTEDAALLDMDLGEEEPAAEEVAVEEAAAPEQAAETEPEVVAEEVSLDMEPAADEEEDFDLSSLDDVDEISTKLDLARAYLDMGDHEGTRGILEEVIAEGNDEQKKEAADLMAKLD